MTKKKKAKIINRHLDAMRNKTKAIILTGKAMDEIVLALKTARRGTAQERDYLKGIIGKIEKQRR